jgi:hypothetical protein
MKAVRRESHDIEYTILKFPMTIHGPNGDVKGKKGDYLITEGERQYFMPPGEFLAAFSPKVDPPSAPPTYVPYPVPYPVYPQPRPYQPYWYAGSWTVPLGNATITSPNISIGTATASDLSTNVLRQMETISDGITTNVVNAVAVRDASDGVTFDAVGE